MKLIYRAGDIIEAHIIAGLLQAEGIEPHVSGHYLQGGIGELAPAGFSNIHVADQDIPLATSVIQEYESKQQKPPAHSSSKELDLVIKLITAILIILFIITVYFITA